MSVAKASQTNLFSTSTKPGSLTKRHILVVNAAQRWLEKWHLKITNENTRCLQLKTWRKSTKPEKEFACEECHYTTMTKAYSYLKDHIRRMHVARGVGWMCVEGACEKNLRLSWTIGCFFSIKKIIKTFRVKFVLRLSLPRGAWIVTESRYTSLSSKILTKTPRILYRLIQLMLKNWWICPHSTWTCYD